MTRPGTTLWMDDFFFNHLGMIQKAILNNNNEGCGINFESAARPSRTLGGEEELVKFLSKGGQIYHFLLLTTFYEYTGYYIRKFLAKGCKVSLF